jgi:hypothetical protein
MPWDEIDRADGAGKHGLISVDARQQIHECRAGNQEVLSHRLCGSQRAFTQRVADTAAISGECVQLPSSSDQRRVQVRAQATLPGDLLRQGRLSGVVTSGA